MEDNCQEVKKSYQLFGEEFAWVAITAIVTYTFMIINIESR